MSFWHDPQVRLVFQVMVKMGARDKLEPRESQETLALQASLDLRVLPASVTPASVPTMPAWHKDLTPKTWRGNKKKKKTKIEEELQVQLYLGTCLFQELFGEKEKLIVEVWSDTCWRPVCGGIETSISGRFQI